MQPRQLRIWVMALIYLLLQYSTYFIRMAQVTVVFCAVTTDESARKALGNCMK